MWNWWLSETTAILLPPYLSALHTSDSVQDSKSYVKLFLSHASSPTKICFALVSSCGPPFGSIFCGVGKFRRNSFLIISFCWPSWRKSYPVHCYRLKVSFTPVLTMYLVFFNTHQFKVFGKFWTNNCWFGVFEPSKSKNLQSSKTKYPVLQYKVKCLFLARVFPHALCHALNDPGSSSYYFANWMGESL